MKLINHLRLLLLGMWLGAALFFSAVVAPGAFAVLRSYQIANAGEIAGALVNRSLAVINVGGFVIGVLLLVSGLLMRRQGGARSHIVEWFSLLLMTLATAVGNWVIAARLHALRLTLSTPVEQLPPANPQRILFDSLHSYSVKALSVAMIAALAVFVMLALQARGDAK